MCAREKIGNVISDGEKESDVADIENENVTAVPRRGDHYENQMTGTSSLSGGDDVQNRCDIIDLSNKIGKWSCFRSQTNMKNTCWGIWSVGDPSGGLKTWI